MSDRGWKEYNDALVRRCEILLDLSFLANWSKELLWSMGAYELPLEAVQHEAKSLRPTAQNPYLNSTPTQE